MSTAPVKTPVMVASENGRLGLQAAMALLRGGGRALDAVELACRIVEDDPDEHSVGYSGLPNVLGEVELDASIMDGRTLRAGAVGAVMGYGRVITLARRVMEETPHVLLVGRGAERLAAELGEPPQDQRTDEALRRWAERFTERGLTPGDTTNLRAAATLLTSPVNLQDKLYRVSKPDSANAVTIAGQAAGPHAGPAAGDPNQGKLGTVNFLALDQYGDLASAVSTSGIAWKYPGRVGDSPLIGPGNYCDNRYGAAACTGMGELAIRAGTAHSLVLYLKLGMSLHAAGLETLRDLQGLAQKQEQYMNIVALTPQGEHAGFTTVPGKNYLYMTAEMDLAALVARTSLEPN